MAQMDPNGVGWDFKFAKALKIVLFLFPSWTYEIGTNFKFLLPYPERTKKNKHFSDNFMKIGWKITKFSYF